MSYTITETEYTTDDGPIFIKITTEGIQLGVENWRSYVVWVSYNNDEWKKVGYGHVAYKAFSWYDEFDLDCDELQGTAAELMAISNSLLIATRMMQHDIIIHLKKSGAVVEMPALKTYKQIAEPKQ